MEHQPSVCVHSAICETYLVHWYSRDLWTNGGGGGVSLPWVYVYPSYICETSLQCNSVAHTSMVNWRRGLGSVCSKYLCILLYVKLL